MSKNEDLLQQASDRTVGCVAQKPSVSVAIVNRQTADKDFVNVTKITIFGSSCD